MKSGNFLHGEKKQDLIMNEFILRKTVFFFLALNFFSIDFLAIAQESSRVVNKNKLTAEEMAPLALKDSMYYHFDEWFARFKGEINRLESAVPSLDNQVELMKFHFNYAGLLGELCQPWLSQVNIRMKK